MVVQLKVLIISEHYFPIKGGSTTYVHNLCKSLSRAGCKVFLVTIPSNKTSTLTWEKTDDFYVYRLKIPKAFRKERYFPFFLASKIKGLIKEVNPDIIHFAHGFFAPLLTRMGVHKPIVWTIQNVPPYEHELDFIGIAPFHRRLEGVYFFISNLYGRFVFKWSNFDSLICVSERTAEHAMKRGIPQEKIHVIHDGVDTELFSPRRAVNKIKKKLGIQNYKPLILTVAGITPHKGQNNLIDIAPKVLEQYPQALFLLVGPIRSRSYFRSLQKLVNTLEVNDNLLIIPGVEPFEIYQYYVSADVYVQPSLEEGFCMSVLEAMASGKPVLGTKTGAIPKLIGESGGGILVEPASPEHLGDALLKLLADPVKRGKMGSKARRYVIKNYSWKKIADETLALYQELIR